MFLNSVGHPYLRIDIPLPGLVIKIIILILPSGFVIRTKTNSLTFFVGHREQINRLTSFIDGGTLYGDSLLSHALLNAPNGRCKINAHYFLCQMMIFYLTFQCIFKDVFLWKGGEYNSKDVSNLVLVALQMPTFSTWKCKYIRFISLGLLNTTKYNLLPPGGVCKTFTNNRDHCPLAGIYI